MLASIKKALKWGSLVKKTEDENWQSSLLLAIFVGILEDVLFWKNMWSSFLFICILNIIYFISLHLEVNFMEFVFYVITIIVAMDGFEAWLKYKHRTTCLKKLAHRNGQKLSFAAAHLKEWMKMRWCEYIYLRETNHTKAFLMMNIFLGMVFFLGKYISGYKLMYAMLMATCFFYKIFKPIIILAHKIHQNAESDGELEGLIPEITDGDIKILSLESETKHVIDEKQSLDYWKPEDVPMEDSDSSDQSSSLVTNMSLEKMQAFEKEVEITDSSEDEYIPFGKEEKKNRYENRGLSLNFGIDEIISMFHNQRLEKFASCSQEYGHDSKINMQQKQLQSTLEEVQPGGAWSGAAYTAFFNLAGAVTNMVYAFPDDQKRKRVSSVDSSDGFEMIDKNDLN